MKGLKNKKKKKKRKRRIPKDLYQLNTFQVTKANKSNPS